MRLIDADELMKHKGNCYDEEGHLLYAVGTGNIMRMPTIDAVPVKHGRWNPHPFEKEWDVCSSCGIGCKRREREFDHLGKKSVTEYSYQYCPWCGAKMDGRRTDE